VNGELDDPARSQVSGHLRVCATCRSEAEELETLWTALGAIPAAEPSGELRARFNLLLEAYQHGVNHAPVQSRWAAVNSWVAGWWPRQPALQFGLALALLVAGIGLGRQIYSPRVQPQANEEVSELRRELLQTQRLVAVSLMQQESASQRLKGVNWSYQLQQPGGEVLSALLDTLMHDPNLNVRLATVDALRQFGDQPAVRSGVVQAIAREESPMVQVALIDLAVDLREKESIETLRQLASAENVNGSVRLRAQQGIDDLE
jgi:hypothetical protein